MSEQSEIKLHALDYWQVVRNRYGVILLAFFLVFMTALVIAYLRPSEYLGKVQLQVERVGKDLEVFPTTGGRRRDGRRRDELPAHDFHADPVRDHPQPQDPGQGY